MRYFPPTSATVVPRSHQNSLYAPPTSASRLLVSRLSRLFRSIVRLAKAAASASVRSSLPANSAGRSSAVSVEKLQVPDKSGCGSFAR